MQNQNYTAVIIDDEKDARDLLSNMLNDYPEINLIDTASHGQEGLYLLSKHHPDIAFLDIDMPEKNGLEVLKEINSIHRDIQVVLVTAYEQYAVESIKYHPQNYLLKPIDQESLRECISLIERENFHSKEHPGYPVKKKSTNKLKIHTKNGLTLIDTNKIYYCRADGNYTEISLTNQSKIHATIQIGKLMDKLPHNNFFRISRSEIVNIEFVKEIQRKEKKLLLNINGKEFSLHIAPKKCKELEREL